MSKNTAGPKWTPGPWACHPFRAYVVPAEHLNRPIGASENDAEDLREFAQEICLLHWPDRHRPESEVKANAQLIAAAPDLYAALEKIVEHFGDPLKVARAALAKARGKEPTA